MTSEVWREVVIDSVEEIASTQTQIDLWLSGNDKQCSSPAEAYATLFSEVDFEGFMVDKNIGLSNGQRDKGLRLEHALEVYYSKADRTPSSHEETLEKTVEKAL